MSDAWEVFVMDLNLRQLESERVGPTRKASELRASLRAESFGAEGHRTMLASHEQERQWFMSASRGWVQQSALDALVRRLDEVGRWWGPEPVKPVKVKKPRLKQEPRFTAAQLAIAVAVVKSEKEKK